MSTKIIGIHVIIDEAGDYVVGKDETDAVEGYLSEFSGSPTAMSRYCLKIEVPLPEVTELTASVEEQNGPIQLKIVG